MMQYINRNSTIINVYAFVITLFFLITVALVVPGIVEKKKPGFVTIDEISLSSLNETLQLAADYVLRTQAPSGQIAYSYYPDRYLFSSDNNMIRQFMTTFALAEMHGYTQDERFISAFRRNLAFNMDSYYTEQDGQGFIFYDNEANLGASALASIAARDLQYYAHQRQKLIDFVLFMQNADGKFNTFHIPPNDTINQRFYSGEAMLSLIFMYYDTNNKTYLDAAQKSFEFYKNYFIEKEKLPAFVPWHTISDYHLYKITNDKKYADYIFEINDWLLELQNTACANPYELGQFYDPQKPEYGIPHASSTAVYMEGLSYAYRLAKEFNDRQRMESYKQAMLLGARSLMELQFKKDDLEYREDASLILGGMRTTLQNQEIRIDNNQHTIMALLGVLEVLSEDDIEEFVRMHKEFDCSPNK